LRGLFVVTCCRYDKAQTSHNIDQREGDYFGSYIKYPPSKNNLRSWLKNIPDDKVQPIYHPKPIYKVINFLKFIEEKAMYHPKTRSYERGVFIREGDRVRLTISYRRLVKLMRGVCSFSVHDFLMALEADKAVSKSTNPKGFSYVVNNSVVSNYKVDRVYSKLLVVDEVRVLISVYRNLFSEIEQKEEVLFEKPVIDQTVDFFENEEGKPKPYGFLNPVLNYGDEMLSKRIKLGHKKPP